MAKKRHHKMKVNARYFTRKKASAERRAHGLRERGCEVRIHKVTKEQEKKHPRARYVVDRGPCR